MTSTAVSTAPSHPPQAYWEARAQRFAVEGEGLAAVCSYGMPAFYNRVVDLSQRLALVPWLRVRPGTSVLDVGCGVGRWCRELARRGARVTGVDFSPTMIAEARRRAAARGVLARCRFLVQDLAHLDAGEKFDLVLGVTVLQHILEPQALRAAVRRLADHLSEAGRLVLLEAAPERSIGSCDSPIFQARPRSDYLRLFAECGLTLRAIRGVDPAPFKIWLWPHLPRLAGPVRTAALALATFLSIPMDVLLGRRSVERSWHAVFILEHAREHAPEHAGG
ncbi:MAG: class I SAM-dependent methyltransferase [Gammaproteobacteria bacterium]|nr:MAG: class I SAM-dependent methyltransferase [Gammaproteobacteria bacterium]TLZ19623.1 MAG: class I SAM-dependent methyltransferase [Gammaproteobacteria bacterium]